MRKTEPPLMTIADTMAYLQCSRRLSCWVPNSGTLLGTGNVGIGVHFRTFSVCAVCLEVVGIPPFWHEKRASGFLRKPSRRSQRDSVSVAIKPLFSMVFGCVRIENHRKYTEKYTGSCALFEKRRHTMNVHRTFTFHSV